MRNEILKVEPDTVRHSGTGATTGDIWLSLGHFAFPSIGWNDFVVRILGWWITGMAKILDGVSAEEDLLFMDGPYYFTVKRLSTVSILLIFYERRRSTNVEHNQSEVEVLPFCKNLLSCAERILAQCEKQKIETSDTAELTHCVSVIRRKLKGLQ